MSGCSEREALAGACWRLLALAGLQEKGTCWAGGVQELDRLLVVLRLTEEHLSGRI